MKIYHAMHTKLYKVSLLGFNIMGNSSFDHVSCDKCLNLYYNETNMRWPIKDHIMSLNHHISKQGIPTITIVLNQLSYILTLKVSNTVIRDNFLHIRSSCACREESTCNTLLINNCQFKDIGACLINC